MLAESSDYRQFLTDVKQLIRQAQYQALQQVNQHQIRLYWDIGRLIVERQQQYAWGRSVVETMARDLQTEFVGMSGFSPQNLWYMRQFYLEYSQSSILQPVVGEISWSKHLLIMARCKDEHERFFYTIQTGRNNWSRTVLLQQIENQTYQKTLLSQHNFPQTLPVDQQHPATLAIKDEYTFDFLGLAAQHSEYDLEQALLANIRKFLIEMGGEFAFIGNQYMVVVEDQEFRIDLLLFHRQLQCLVAIELKVDEFKPEYAGKMNFYLSALNRLVKKPHENPSIGIIICKSKKRTFVEFALQDVNKPIGVSTYTFTPSLPKELGQFFPSNEEFVQRVEAVTKALNQGKK